MATGGGEDSPDVAIRPDVVEKEEQQAEAVFLSYTFHMSAMRSENGDSRPLNGEIEDARQTNREYDKVGRQLATIGDDIYKRYETTFDNFLKDLDPNLENAYEIFKKIASRSFPQIEFDRYRLKDKQVPLFCNWQKISSNIGYQSAICETICLSRYIYRLYMFHI
ncbi:hypothetical protein GDO81_029615 [Engystomops pustulosus]|uniref:Uncharacterized protein n=1 Tax=Engystomops pustulosus TaxID=76066 RepID=A0AAV6ZHC6_ENGPU|nr:hypothetical protein GDO81_029615 [Engystomops pustulosus]KAG8546884.1 hypothetical protein GDO81_029615 [Engystomops pustulosus]